jgi:hypothetical protein
MRLRIYFALYWVDSGGYWCGGKNRSKPVTDCSGFADFPALVGGFFHYLARCFAGLYSTCAFLSFSVMFIELDNKI